jgi:ABC-type nitrate/sulfonate/bicarbonate transport system substrate-binding protein
VKPGPRRDARSGRPRFTRRSALIAGCGLIANSLPIPRSAAAAKGELVLGFLALPDPANTGHWIALERKLFDAEGLSTRFISGGPNSPPLLTLLSAGKIDVARANWFSVLDAAAKGNDFVVVAAGYPQNPTCLISLPKRPIRTAQDIVNKKLLLQFRNYTEIIDTILKYNNLPVKYSVVPTGYNVDALLAGDGDGYFAFVIYGPVNLEMRGLKRGVDFIVSPLSGMHYDLPDNLYVVRRETLNGKRGALTAYFRAILRGMAVDEKNPAYAVDLVTKKYAVDNGLDPKAQLLTSQAYLPLSKLPGGKGPLWFSPVQIDRMYEFARISGRSSLPERSKAIDLGPLEEALRSI